PLLVLVARPRDPAQRIELARVQLAPLSRLEVTQLYRTVTHATQPLHTIAQLFEHATDFALASLAPRQHDALATAPPRRARTRPSISQLHTAPQLLERSVVDCGVDLDIVFAVDAVSRMQQTVRGIAVIRQQHQPLAVEVQAPDIKQPPHRRRHELVQRPAPLRIAARTQIAARLVQRKPLRRRGADPLPIHTHIIARLHTHAELVRYAAVDRHAPADDQLLTRAPRRYACLRQILLETDAALLHHRRSATSSSSGASSLTGVSVDGSSSAAAPARS